MTPRGVVDVNGRLVAAAEARVSVFDRGFQYGDGLFETLRAYGGVPFALAEHLRRLEASARLLGIPVPRVAWGRRIGAVLRRNRLGNADAWVRVTLTRGTAAPGLLPPAAARPTSVIVAGRIASEVSRLQRRGARVVLLPFARTGFLSEHKTLDYLPAVVGKTVAARHRAFEGLYVNASGCVTEGTTTNLFALRGTRLLTPAIDSILPGVTRSLVMELASRAGVRLEKRRIASRDLASMDEVFLTSAVVEILPVIRVDERPVGSGRVGPVTRKFIELYQELVACAASPAARF